MRPPENCHRESVQTCSRGLRRLHLPDRTIRGSGRPRILQSPQMKTWSSQPFHLLNLVSLDKPLAEPSRAIGPAAKPRWVLRAGLLIGVRDSRILYSPKKDVLSQ